MSALPAIDNHLSLACFRRLAILCVLFATCLGLVSGMALAEEGENVPLKPIAQLTVDDDGKLLSYPTAVFYDPGEEEIYLVNGASGRVVVYGPDFFPRASIGVGRGIGAPRGGEVRKDGEVYICQARTRKSAARRITILNGAFFVEREINLEEIPQAADVQPRQVAVSRDGTIYVAGDSSRGVVVLDEEGNYLRRLQPVDIIRDRETIEAWAKKEGTEVSGQAEGGEVPAGDGEKETPAEVEPGTEDPLLNADIPEEFRPRSSQPKGSKGGISGLGPVKVVYVAIDKTGNIYLVSNETSKVYVYGPDEEFLFSFGKKGGTPRHLSQPRALAIDDERGLVFVVDYMRHTVLVYNLSGDYLFEFGGRGWGPGWFNFPTDIAINRHGQVIIADLFNRRVQVLELLYEEIFPMYGSRKAFFDTKKEKGGGGDQATPDQQAPPPPESGGEETQAPTSEVPVHLDMDAEPEGEITPQDGQPEQPDSGVEEVHIPIVEIPGYPPAEGGGQPAPGESLPGKKDDSESNEISPEGQPGGPEAESEGKNLPEKYLPGRPR